MLLIQSIGTDEVDHTFYIKHSTIEISQKHQEIGGIRPNYFKPIPSMGIQASSRDGPPDEGGTLLSSS
jgi:hypothetical protein